MNIYIFGDLTIPAIIVTVGIVGFIAYALWKGSKEKITVDELEDLTKRWKGE